MEFTFLYKKIKDVLSKIKNEKKNKQKKHILTHKKTASFRLRYILYIMQA